MEKKVPQIFVEPQSNQCESISYFGIGISNDELMKFCKNYQKSEEYGSIIMDCMKGEYDYETVDELIENEGYMDSVCGRDIVGSVGNKLGLQSSIYFTPGDEDYYLIGIPLENGDEMESLNKIQNETTMNAIKKASDLFGVKFGFYSAIAWFDF